MKAIKKIAALGVAAIFIAASVSASAHKSSYKRYSDEVSQSTTDSLLDGGPLDAVSTVTRHKENIGLEFNARNLTPGNAYTLWVLGWSRPRKCADPCECNIFDFGNEDVKPSMFGAITGRVADQYGQLSMEAVQNYMELPEGEGQVLFGGPIADRRAQITLVLRDHGPASSDPAVLENQLTQWGGGCDTNECVDVAVSRHRGAYCKVPRKR